MSTSSSLFLADQEATESLGGRLGGCCPGGTMVYLYGDLGAGKTTLVRGLLRGYGHRGAVKSPTYTLVEPYQVASRRIYHFDLYRLADPEELEYLGGRDYFDGEALCLVEWPQQGRGWLPEPDLEVSIHYRSSGRQVDLAAHSERGRRVLTCLLA